VVLRMIEGGCGLLCGVDLGCDLLWIGVIM